MSQAVISIEHASKSYRGGQAFALREVTVSVESGSFVALIGDSGSGKTTLLKTINRLVDLDSGVARVAGEAVNGVAAHELRRRIGYVFQGIGLFPHLSVAENIGVTPRLLGWPADQVQIGRA